jgi:tRNA(His) guanylyltransferase
MQPKGNATIGQDDSEGEEAQEIVQLSKTQVARGRKMQKRAPVVVKHVDIIKDEFWEHRPWLISNKPGKLPSDN